MRQPSSAPPRTPPFWLQRVGPRKFSNPQILFATVLFILSMLAWNIIILSDMSSADKPEQHPTGSVGDFRPLVAVMTPVASDSYPAPWNSTSLPLFTKMLPSLIENLNCEFRYVVMIGYRKGDAYYDSPEGMSELEVWFETHVHSPLQKQNFDVDLVSVRVPTRGGDDNVLAKYYSMQQTRKAFQRAVLWLTSVKHDLMQLMGQESSPCVSEMMVDEGEEGHAVVNVLARKAYSLGANYLYRVHEDTVFFGRFAKPFASILSRSGKPYGIVGPCSFRKGDANYLLQHHFVHRTHMDVFEMQFYPQGLEPWWTDQWVSRVYGPQRTFISKYIGTVTRPAIRHQYILSNSAGYIATWVKSSRQDIHHWLEKEHHSNLTVAENLKHFYSGIGKNVMTALDMKPEFEHLNLECSSLSGTMSARFHWCLTTKRLHRLEYPSDLTAKASRMTVADRINWKLKNCSGKVLDFTLKNKFFGQNGNLVKKKHTRALNLHLRPPLVQCPSPSDASSPLPLIAVMAATTSRNIEDPSNATISLMKTMLPSLLFSLDCGFRYVVVLGCDTTDGFYSSREGEAMLRDWFETHMATMMRRRGVQLQLELMFVLNPVHKPGPVFLAMARRAYALGADYMYRVNDDTEFIERWPQVFVEALRSLSPPYGVIGPRSFNTDNRILTHDFVHRTHMDVFNGWYYPEELQDWWMDDWISSVYGPHRSFMSKNITIYHHIKAHGKRYKVDFEHEARLSPLTIQGRQQVAAWMQKHQSPAREQLAFFNDTKKDPTAEDVKLQYFSTGNIVEKYHEILCSKRRNVTFCPYDSPLNVRKTKTPRVPDQLSSGAERVE